MKKTTIIADPFTLLKAGVRNTMDLAVLIHLGRCGLQGSTVPQMLEHFHEPYSSIRCAIDRLEELDLCLAVCRKNNSGRAQVWVVSVSAWTLLVTPADFSLFPHAQTPLPLKP
jgi:hypothetical protein